MSKIVQVPNIGNVEFPDSMSDDEISAALRKTNFSSPGYTPPSDASTAGAAFRSFEHGVMPFDAQVVGGGNAIQRKLQGDPRPFSEIYADERDQRRALSKQDREEHPGVSFVGDLAGTVAGPAKLLPGASLPQALGSGALLGGVRSAGEGQDLEGIAKGAGAGAAGAGLGYGAAKVLSPAARAIASKLRGGAIDNGRKVLMGGAQSLSRKAPVSEDAVQEALDVGAIKPFGSTAGTAERLRGELDATGQKYSDIVDLLTAKGVTGPDAHALAAQVASKGEQAGANTLNRAVPNVYEQAAQDLPSKAVPIPGALGPGNVEPLPLSRAEALKRSLQHLAQYDRTVPTDVNDARMDVASMLRQANEDAIATGAAKAGPDAQAAAAQFQPVKQQYGRLAEATRAAEGGVAQAARRSGPNLTDTIHQAAITSTQGPIIGLGAKLLSALNRTRGPSTKAWLENALANKLEPAAAAQMALPDSTQSALAEAIRRALLLPPPVIAPPSAQQP